MDGTHRRRFRFRGGLNPIFQCFQFALHAQRHLRGIVQKSRCCPRVGILNHVRSHADRVHVQVVNGEGVVFPNLIPHRDVWVPIESGLSRGIHLADVGHVGRHRVELAPCQCPCETCTGANHQPSDILEHTSAGRFLVDAKPVLTTQENTQNYGRAEMKWGCLSGVAHRQV